MRLTLRGLGVLLVVALAMVLAFVSGERSLNAVAAPLLGAVLYGTVQLWRAEPPTVTPGALRPGFPGETREWTVALDGHGVVSVSGDWPTGVDGPEIDAVVGLPETLAVELTLLERGVYDLDGLSVRRRDALGLVEKPVTVRSVATATVYPRVYHLGRHEAFSELLADEHQIERQEFDQLREYEPGDPLRRIHWKSSAKYDEFLVVEFAPGRRTERVTIAAETVPSRADEMAAAVGTVALLALRAGFDVGLDLPDEHLPAGSGAAHRANLLGLLARATAGPISNETHEAADVSVLAGPRATTVRVGGTAYTFEDIVSDGNARPIREVAAT